MVEDLRFAKIDDAIQRLAVVSADLSKMLAVHELRLDTQEKASDSLIASIEKRREEIDARFRDFQHDIYDQLKTIKDNSTIQHSEQNKKIEGLQKYIWMFMGIISFVSFILPTIITKFFR